MASEKNLIDLDTLKVERCQAAKLWDRAPFESYARYIRRAARIISEQLCIPYDKMSLRMLVEPENFELILNTLDEELEGAKKGNHSVRIMASSLVSIARNYFAVPVADQIEIDALIKQIETPKQKLTIKNVARLRAIYHGKKLELLRLPAKLINNTLRKIQLGTATPQDLADAKVGVAIAILLNIPLRKGNLVALRVGDNVQIPNQSGVQGRLLISGENVKNKDDIDRPIPLDLLNLLRVYVTEILPLLGAVANTKSLFPGAYGDGHQSPSGLGCSISKRVSQHLGIEMNAHLFRHFAAIAYLEDHPGDYEVVRLLLGNKDLNVIKMFYTGLEKDAALRKVELALAKHKKEAGLSSANMLIVSSPRKRG